MSEPLLVALVLGAVRAVIAGRARSALVLGVVESAPFQMKMKKQ